jgi:hypothetical protein
MSEKDEWQGTACPDAYESQEDQNKDLISDSRYAILLPLLLLIIFLIYNHQ